MTWSTTQLLAWIARIEARAPRSTLFELLELGTTADPAAITAAFHKIAAVAHPDLHRRDLSPADTERLLGAYGKVAAAYDTLRDAKSRERYRKEIADRGRPISQSPVVGGSQAIPVERAPTAPPASSSSPSLPRITGPISTSSSSQSLPRVTTPPASTTGRFPTVPPDSRARGLTPSPDARAATPSRSPSSVRPRTASPAPPLVMASRTTTPPSIARTTTPPSIARTTTPPGRASVATGPVPTTTRPPSVTRSGIRESRPPPAAGVSARATIYFRKAQSCLTQGDLGGALFNLRLAAAADPASALIRVALAEVEHELTGKK